MANNQYVNKVVLNGSTLMDVSGTTVAADKLLQGYTAVGPDGSLIQGSLQQQSIDFSGVNVTADKMLKGTYALDSSGNLIEGSIDVDEILKQLTSVDSPLLLKIDDDLFLKGSVLVSKQQNSYEPYTRIIPTQASVYSDIAAYSDKYFVFAPKSSWQSINGDDVGTTTLCYKDSNVIYSDDIEVDDIDCFYVLLKSRSSTSSSSIPSYITKIYKIDKFTKNNEYQCVVDIDENDSFKHITFGSGSNGSTITSVPRTSVILDSSNYVARKTNIYDDFNSLADKNKEEIRELYWAKLISINYGSGGNIKFRNTSSSSVSRSLTSDDHFMALVLKLK